MGTRITTSEIFGRRVFAKRAARRGEGFNVGLLLPASGAMGLLGPSAYACAQLGCEMWNDAGGVQGEPVRLTVLDSGESSPDLHPELDRLLAMGELDALVALCNTDVCQRVSRIVDSRVPLMFTPQFEGGGLPSWVHAFGETPDRQLLPALDWMTQRYRTRRWYLLGSDYCWPRRAHAAAVGHLKSAGAQVVGESYVPLGERDFEPVLEHIGRSRADAVLLTLIGSDAVHMCRAFGAAGLSDRVLRLSICVEENALLGMGYANTAGMFASAGYFASVDSDANGAFKERYHARFGARAPALNSQAQSVYEGFVHLQRQTQTPRTGRALRDGSVLDSVRAARPRRSQAEPSRDNPIYLAEAQGMTMRVIQSLAGARG
ncbi:Aliphatic amidase expression-regulating protein [Variovorax sp. PBL-H6]|uniref:substrate-binding domain-containing protein n=1 Tax=Variovorax sp. PBL-H6 TaxID=434009 RepID=UPI001317406D|nr:substrate-binding domain-containing protein [Variovorax sp. PBL-H6]VTU26711.1 Aliphatic amidase expression-regulating protein [Variovorax sp. PBL-H6]